MIGGCVKLFSKFSSQTFIAPNLEVVFFSPLLKHSSWQARHCKVIGPSLEL